MEECLFCKIVRREIPASVVYEDDDVLAFRDIQPGAPIHVLVIPREHLSGIIDATAQHTELLGKILVAIPHIARLLGVAESGFRAVINSGADAQQSVHHLHVHVLGGRGLTWPPG